jgi:hypothetical protein
MPSEFLNQESFYNRIELGWEIFRFSSIIGPFRDPVFQPKTQIRNNIALNSFNDSVRDNILSYTISLHPNSNGALQRIATQINPSLRFQ